MGDKVAVIPDFFLVTLGQATTAKNEQFLESCKTFNGLGQGFKGRTFADTERLKNGKLSYPLWHHGQRITFCQFKVLNGGQVLEPLRQHAKRGASCDL